MGPFRRTDVKNHLSARGRAESGTFLAANKLDLPAFSAAETAAFEADPTGFAEDYFGEHVAHGMRIVPAEPRSPQE